MQLTAGIILSYLAGAIPFGYLVVLFVARQDIRTIGSGNIGATNVYRLLGIRWATLVFALDCSKGAAVTYFFPSLFGAPAGKWFTFACALAAVLGHMYPVFLKFKGGKGVAVSAGVALGLGLRTPLLLLSLFFSLLLWAGIFKKFHYVSLASLAAAISFFLFTLVFNLDKEFQLFAFSVMIGIVLRHRQNIQRLIKRKELKC